VEKLRGERRLGRGGPIGIQEKKTTYWRRHGRPIKTPAEDPIRGWASLSLLPSSRKATIPDRRQTLAKGSRKRRNLKSQGKTGARTKTEKNRSRKLSAAVLSTRKQAEKVQ